MRYGFSTVTGFSNPWLKSVWDDIHRRLGERPSSSNPVHLPISAFRATAEAYDGMDLAAIWADDRGGFVTPAPSSPRVRLAHGGHAEIIAFAPERIVVKYTSDSRQPLVVSEPWYPGWTARVNDTQAPVDLSDGWMRAVTVPAGTGTVELHYASRWLPLGAVISIISAVFAAGWWIRGARSATPPSTGPRG